MEKTHCINTYQKKARGVTFISDWADLKARGIVRGEKGHCIIMRRSALSEDTAILNVYTPNKNHRIMWGKTNTYAERDRWVQYCSWRFQRLYLRDADIQRRQVIKATWSSTALSISRACGCLQTLPTAAGRTFASSPHRTPTTKDHPRPGPRNTSH